jgi:hypothetical protein
MTILDIALFATADAVWQNCLDEYINTAKYHLGNFEIRMNLYPARPANPTLLPLFGPVHDRVPDYFTLSLAGHVRAACHVALPEPHGIPVIFCKFDRRGDAGVTILSDDLTTNLGVNWLNYILVNADVLSHNRDVVLHELIHAAEYVGDTDRVGNRYLHDSDPASVMRIETFAPPALPVAMYERHAAALRRAYFARQVD